MICALLLAVTPALLSPSFSLATGHIDASLDFEGELLGHRFVDITGDGKKSLCVALRLGGGRRELRVLELSRRGFGPNPSHTISILEDVLAYSFADVREERGKELVLLTRTGAYSYSLTREGYRGNIERLLTEDLIYDVPDNRSLPYWEYTSEAPGGDQILLPGRSEFAIWGPASKRSDTAAEERSDPYEVHARFGSITPNADKDDSTTEEAGGSLTLSGSGAVSVEIQNSSDGPFLAASESSSALLSDAKGYSAPAFIDIDGDGRKDLILRKKSELQIYICGPNGISAEPTRIEEIPEYLLEAKDTMNLEFAHLNGDNRIDLIATVEEDSDSFENAQMRVLILLNDGERLLPVRAQQVFRFEAAMLRVSVADVNADGVGDLLMRKFVLPSMLESVTGLEFELTYLAFLGIGKGARPFERKPVLNQTEIYDESNIGDVVKSRRITLDCDGDGIPDLVEVGLRGRIVVRRLRHDSGFFSGDTWELDETPWKRFEARGAILALTVLDVNDDGLADIVSPSRQSLTVLLSRNQ